jgi:PTH1 family peptidyl-tRNA hydrolase
MFDRLNDLFEKIKSGSSSRGNMKYIIVGLGNPGSKYANTRHNVGFWAIDKLAADLRVEIKKSDFKSLCCEAVIADKRVLLLKPHTYMNLCGEAVYAVASWYKLPMERVIIIYDDISLPPGKMRIRAKGSAGGHNGIKSIIEQTDTDEFPRIKIGVGQKPHKDYDLADWVLSVMPENEHKLINEAIANAIKSVELIVEGKIEEAINKYSR